LEAKDFQVAEDGNPQRISCFSHDQLPLSVVFLFDLTDTVRPTLKPLTHGAYEMLGQAARNSRQFHGPCLTANTLPRLVELHQSLHRQLPLKCRMGVHLAVIALCLGKSA
jgi:hypothetical protein